MEQWKKVKLSEIITIFSGKNLPERNRVNGEYNVYGSSGVIGTHNQYSYNGEAILIGRKGNVGSILWLNEAFFNIDSVYYSILKDKDCNLKYIYYYLSMLDLKILNKHSVIPGLNRDDVYDLEIPLPPLETQNKIAKILSTIDEKIENNNEINAKLEEMAQLLYNQWFVEFEFPNKNGQPYKSSGGEMVESELGLIPKGWEVDNLGNQVKISTGKKDANFGTKDGKYTFFTCSKESIKAPSYSFNTKAFILAGNGEFHFNWFEGKFEAYQRVYVIEILKDNMFEFLYYGLERNIKSITSKSGGSIIKYLTMNMITDNKIILPNENIISLYSKNIKPIMENIKTLNNENQKLKEIRDLLLYQLMNNKIDIDKMEGCL